MKRDTVDFDCVSVATSLENEITVMNGNLYFVVLAESVWEFLWIDIDSLNRIKEGEWFE